MVKEASCETGIADPTGAVSGGHLVITGPVVDIVAISREVASDYASSFDWTAKRLPSQRYSGQSSDLGMMHTYHDFYNTDPDPDSGSGQSCVEECFWKAEVDFETDEQASLSELGRKTISTTALTKQPPGLPRPGPSAMPQTILSREVVQGSITKSNELLRVDDVLKRLSLSFNDSRGASTPPTELDFGATDLNHPQASNAAVIQTDKKRLQQRLLRHKLLDRPVMGETSKFGAFTFGFHADTIISNLHLEELICLLIASTGDAPRALILRKAKCHDSKIALYERVGLIDRIIFGSAVRSNGWMPLFQDAGIRTVTII